jgi:ATP-dependent Zn protease
MASGAEAPSLNPRVEEGRLIHEQWRSLTRAATLVAVVTAPAAVVWLHNHVGWNIWWSLLGGIGLVICFRGLVDVCFRRFLPWPSLFGLDNARVREEDVVNRRRAWFWSSFVRWAIILGGLGVLAWWLGVWDSLSSLGPLLLIFPFYFIFNFLILMGPMLFMGISQIRGFEPGDADWGVGLDDVRGQAEAKEEVRKIVNLWQSGEAFVKAGGKRERGILFMGAPGTGKTMLAKAIATGFNSPFVTIPGSGFAQTFIGLDAILVRYLARKAKKMARKWGGTCIVFIDEIDAVGMRRSSLGGASATPASFHDHAFFGPYGALTPTGDLILENRAWRERLFAHRQPPSGPAQPGRFASIVNQAFPGGMMGGTGQLALNQLLVVMDGIDNPPFFRRVTTNWVNSLLDASYIVPRRVGRASLRIPRAKPSKAQIYFIGATNVPIDSLDPALTRAGRLGRHVWFRTPTKKDRQDIFDLYLDKVAHDPDLDRPERRDELARITNGYSPAMVEQVCSMALTYAHHEGDEEFGWEHITEAMTTVESGTAVGVDYIEEETRAVAIHEAGHAAAAHVYMEGAESTRLSIRMRSGSLGHHQALEKEERFSSWRSEEMARLVWTLGAMAAEHVFYGQNSTGVGGDVQSATARSAFMVGASGMGPDRIALDGRANDESEEEARTRIAKRYEQLGLQIMNRASPHDMMHADPITSVLSDPHKRNMAAQILGQAYVYAYNLIAANKDGVEKIADDLAEHKEIYGDNLLRLLDSVDLKKPAVDPFKEESWPTTL